jgi:hypothetical protein
MKVLMHALAARSIVRELEIRLYSISLSHDDEYPPFLGGIQFSLTNADN